MRLLKKTLPLVVAFALGVVITYVLLSMQFAMQRSTEQNQRKQHELDAIKEFYQNEANKAKAQQEEKHWLDERIEEQSAETKERTKQQQSQGDNLKNQFDQFSE